MRKSRTDAELKTVLADLREPMQATNLGVMLRCFMAMERWSMRKLAPEIGVSAATLHRVCAGYAMDADTLMKILNWMSRTPGDGELNHGK